MSLDMTYGNSTHSYWDASYWDRRYSKESAPFDWYQKYSALAPLLSLYTKHHQRILLVGCGNSALAEEMVEDGYVDIVNIDFSSVVIEAMQKKFQNRPQLKYDKMDVRDMSTYQSDYFDAVIDKGTLDSLMCGQNSLRNSAKMLEEIRRVLKKGGAYILITYGAPNFRLSLLKNSGSWNIKLHVIGKLGTGSLSLKEWEMTSPFELNESGNFDTSVLGENPDVHYIYVCIKDESIQSELNDSSV